MPIKDHKDTWATIGSVIGVIAVLMGGIFAVYKYFQEEQSNRNKETLVYVDRYHRSPIFDTRTKLDSAWLRHEGQLIEILNGSDSDYEQFILQVINEERLEGDIFTLVDFFQSVQTCINTKTCDVTTAMSFFCDDAKSFFHLHYRFIAVERSKRNDPALAGLLEKFSKTTCAIKKNN